MKLTYKEVIEKAMPQIIKAFEEGQVKYGDPDIGNLDEDYQIKHIQDHIDYFHLIESYERSNEDGIIKKHHLAAVVARCMMIIAKDELK